MEVHLFGNISSISVSQLCAYNIFTIFWLKSFLVTDCAVFLLRDGRSYGLRRGLSLESIVVPDFAVFLLREGRSYGLRRFSPWRRS